MSIYDIIMLVILGGAIFFGYRKGLAWQIASLAAIIVSYIVAVNFREPVAKFIQVEEPWNRIGAMLILFVGSSLAIWIIYAQVSKSLKTMELKGFDRQAGAMLGAVKGALLCMVITMFSVSLLGQSAQEAIQNSKVGPYVVTGITKVSAIVPEEISRITQKYVDDFHDKMGTGDGTELPKLDVPGVLFGNNTNTYPAGETHTQDTSELPVASPSYKGRWDSPSQNDGLPFWKQPGQTAGNEPGSIQYGTFFNGGSQTQNGTQSRASSQPSSGFPGGSWTNPNPTANGANGVNGTVSKGNNGWPELKFNVNTKDLLDSAARAWEESQKR